MNNNSGVILRCLVVGLVAPMIVMGRCPFAGRGGQPETQIGQQAAANPEDGFGEAVKEIDFDAVEADIEKVLKESRDFWPADYGNYGPFMIRLAWHISGSYRTSDGRGGADGGRQRFEPERSWDDNINLEKAKKILWPVKQKYGLGLSWGDLMVLAGNTAIQSMGGPVLGFCAGRIDDANGDWSKELGPSTEQMELFPCAENGQCKPPLGSTTVGLIYLNPEGPMSQPLPAQSAGEVRDSFGRMAMNDTETVALIGGGHTFGKTHGACPSGAGKPPSEDPANPWPGLCGTGKGADAYTSGFEGPWTTDPTSWDDGQYFHNLLEHQWEKFKGPGNKWQWRSNTTASAPAPDGPGRQSLQMMTSDVSLLHDPTGSYQRIIKKFRDEPAYFANAFAHAWYKLTTRDMGPATRCVGKRVPPVQDWQIALPSPPPPSSLADFSAVSKEISSLFSSHGEFDVRARLVRLTFSCMSSWRTTDYLGGCNGATIRFQPQAAWPENQGLGDALTLLAPIKAKFGAGLSWADLIVLAGSAAVESAGGVSLPRSFCGGRTDAETAPTSDSYLRPRVDGSTNDTLAVMRDYYKVMGTSLRELVALAARPVDQAFRVAQGYEGEGWTKDPTVISNKYFDTLLNEEWQPHTVAKTGMAQFKAVGKELYMLQSDLLIKWDPELMAIAQEFASDESAFLAEFGAAWVRMANVDRYDGPTGNLCEKDEKVTDLVAPL